MFHPQTITFFCSVIDNELIVRLEILYSKGRGFNRYKTKYDESIRKNVRNRIEGKYRFLFSIMIFAR